MKSFAFFVCLCLSVSFAALDIHSMINHVNSQNSGWVAGENPMFVGLSVGQIKQEFLGWNGKGSPLPDVSLFPEITNEYPPIDDLPVNFSSALTWPSCPSIRQIRNQARCGSCWAFGAVEAFTDRYCIEANQGSNPIFSAMYLVTCDRMDNGCGGGEAETAWSFIQKQGLPTNSCQPYTIPTCPPDQQPCLNFVNTPPCNRQCTNSSATMTTYTASKVYGVTGRGGGSAIQQEIMTNGPVEACFDVYEDFVNYKSGVYKHTSGRMLGGHCVKIVGWGVENNEEYWEVANSWTTYWGNKGFFKIIRGINNCGIEDDIVAGLVNVQ